MEYSCEIVRGNESFILQESLIPTDAIINLRRISELFMTLIKEMIRDVNVEEENEDDDE